ncbi:M56 family metallopeptidase [Parablautia intestinalis]|uniref:M56 family metallopeptidase n=1 Tax=Parablautia intestinalis TaxID=2320100 RepID=UPI00259D2035|nr:M56 family metallopeptidase [Parablautia intestinalis]
MSGRWKKIIWALLMVQLCLFHVFLLNKIRYKADDIWYRGCVRLNFPYVLYHKGFVFAVLGTTFVSAVIVLNFLLRYRKFRTECIGGMYPVCEEGLKSRYEKACVRAGIEKGSRKVIYKNAKAATPFVLGFYKPVLVLPKWVKEDETCDMVLLHECVHIRHRDTWYKLFLFLCRAVCWYNPLAYLICSVGRRDIEIDCDETVTAGCGKDERAGYGQFLIDSLKKVQERECIHSAFFCADGREMKARILAIMEEKRPYDMIAQIAAALLVTETVLIIAVSGWERIRKQQEQKAPENIYEGYEKPECFTDETLARMLALNPVGEDAYSKEVQSLSGRANGADTDSQLSFEPDGPWQIRLTRSGYYGESVGQLVQRYLYYDRDQIAASAGFLADGAYDHLETSYQRLLAGNQKEAVFAVVLREFWPETEEEIPSFARLEKVDGYYYAYYPLAVHVKMAGDCVFELQGIGMMDETVEAFRARYSGTDYSDVPCFAGKPALEADTGYAVRTSEGRLEMKKAGEEEWMTVPVSLEDLFTRGDDMDGALTRVQDGSCQCDGVKQIFAYGGCGSYGQSPGLPVQVVFYDGEAGAFRNSVVTKDYASVRRLFVSFPENGQTGYLLLTYDRTMWQECTTCFVTGDGGKSWKEIIVEDGEELMMHSLTMDMRFITNETGFITVRDSKEPHVLRTDDGGRSWGLSSFHGKREYYSIAYAPFWEEGQLVVDVGEEEYSKNGGIKARYFSEDMGENWMFGGFVLKQ